jgi:hypothetical protein
MPSRRLVVIVAGAALVMVAGSITALAIWSSRPPPRIALHAAASPSPTPGASLDNGNPFGVIPASPSAQPTSTEGPASPTAVPTSNGVPLPSSSTPNANQAMLGADADGGPILASIENWPGRSTTSMTTSWKWDGSRWNAIRSDPQIAVGSNLVYDPYLSKTVELAGGVTGIPYTMWGWDGAGWTSLATTTLPSHGYDVALAALDPARRQIVALVPETLTTSATWTFDGQTWTRAATAVNPPARQGAGMAYDPISSNLVLYGGDRIDPGSSGVLDDTWTWDGKNWTQQHAATTPGGGEGQLAYDAATSQMILFCQRQQAAGSRNFSVTTWTWTGTTWTQLHPSTTPPAAVVPMMAYDAVRRDIVFFGSSIISPGPAQTWMYANGQWKQAS